MEAFPQHFTSTTEVQVHADHEGFPSHLILVDGDHFERPVVEALLLTALERWVSHSITSDLVEFGAGRYTPEGDLQFNVLRYEA